MVLLWSGRDLMTLAQDLGLWFRLHEKIPFIALLWWKWDLSKEWGQGNRQEDMIRTDDDNWLSQHENQIALHSQKLISLSKNRKEQALDISILLITNHQSFHILYTNLLVMFVFLNQLLYSFGNVAFITFYIYLLWCSLNISPSLSSRIKLTVDMLEISFRVSSQILSSNPK